MAEQITTLPSYIPYQFDRTLYHGASYSWGFARLNDDGSLLPEGEFAQYQYQAAISDVDGNIRLQYAEIQRFNNQSRISFRFSQDQILALPAGLYLFDLVERDPGGNYSVRLRGNWRIESGATY